MKVNLFTICQAAVPDPRNGTYSIINGGISSLDVPMFPAAIPLVIFVSGTVTKEEMPTHRMEFSVRDENGLPIKAKGPLGQEVSVKIGANMDVKIDPNSMAKRHSSSVVIHTVLPFERPGEYEVRLDIDGDTHLVQLDIRKIDAPGGTS